MSTASPVPETWELSGDDARSALRTYGFKGLLRDSFVRLRVSDGFSHARSLAYATTLVLVQATIVLVGLADALGSRGIDDVIVKTARRTMPGPAASVLTGAVAQAHDAGTGGRYFGLLAGSIGLLVTGAMLMGQFERGLNRIYGIEQDRPTARKYSRAAVLAVVVGALVVVAFSALAFGRAIGDSIGDPTLRGVWGAVAWPLAFVATIVAMTLLFRHVPRRRQPRLSWLAFGTTVATLLWILVTVLLGLFFGGSRTFGETYGPLAGVVALLTWAFLSSIVVLGGGAVAAQLEAYRAGERAPQDAEKLAHAEPEGADPRDRVEAAAS